MLRCHLAQHRRSHPTSQQLGSSPRASGSTHMATQLPESYLVKHVKKIKKGGNRVEYNRASGRRRELVELLNIVDAYPEHLHDIASYAKDHVEAAAKESAQCRGVADAETFAAVDQEWWISWLKTRVYPERQSHVDEIKKKDVQGVHQLIEYIVKTTMLVKMPKECQEDSAVLDLAAVERAKQDGDRIELAKPVLLADGTLDWGHGVYKLTFKDNVATHVTHVPTGAKAKMPPRVEITREFDLLYGWSDLKAAAVCGEYLNFELHKFFVAGAGPHVVPVMKGQDKRFDALAKACKTRLAASTAVVVPARVGITGGASSPSQPQHDTVAIQKAREALAKRQEERARKRRMSLKTTPSMD